MPSIAVTGSKGRLGSALFASSTGGPVEWVRCARTEEPSEGVLASASLTDPTVMNQFDGLLHLAWGVVPKSAQEHPELAREVDLPLLRQLLESAVKAGNRRAKPVQVLFVSTGAVYGNCLNEQGSQEADPAHPLGEYARGKADAEEMIREFVDQEGLCATIFRVSNLYGFPGTEGPPQGVIPRLIEAALTQTPFERWGTDALKDYLHVDDMISAIHLAFSKQLAGVYNVASGQAMLLSEVIAIVEQLTGQTIALRITGTDLPWDAARNRLDPTRWIEAAGWNAEVSLEAGIERLIEEMKS